ncbi:hypothetical protein [Bradyrhizobium sp.]|uniref:hypothetical protein n=1 Tax=Bradyrhizobium sp. TaxID=376 RepID=UPI00261BBCC5|nr:hypothetical protein [Bradyrhizobium sp.]
MMLGDPQSWKRQFISLDERILQRVLHVWNSCVARLPGQPEEDDITTNLIDLLLKDPVVRTLCHWIEYQFEPFGTNDQGAKYSKGIVDLAVLLDFDRETYLPYECKRLNTIHQGRRSSLATPYVNDGLMRFVTEQYAEGLPVGCMLGYVMDGDLAFALQQVQAAIIAQATPLKSRGGITNGEATPSIERFRTDHERDVSAQIEVRHVLLPFAAMAGVNGPT